MPLCGIPQAGPPLSVECPPMATVTRPCEHRPSSAEGPAPSQHANSDVGHRRPVGLAQLYRKEDETKHGCRYSEYRHQGSGRGLTRGRRFPAESSASQLVNMRSSGSMWPV